MTSHSARTMREVSETVVVYTCLINHVYISGINFWHKSLGRVTSKVENLVFYKHETGVLFVEGFAEKFLFCLSSTKLSEVVQDIAFDALAPDCSIQVLPFFFWSLVCSLYVYATAGESNRFLTNPTVCLKSVFRPKKKSFLWASCPSASQTHRGCGQRFAIWGVFLALVVWRLLSKLCNHQHSKLF